MAGRVVVGNVVNGGQGAWMTRLLQRPLIASFFAPDARARDAATRFVVWHNRVKRMLEVRRWRASMLARAARRDMMGVGIV